MIQNSFELPKKKKKKLDVEWIRIDPDLFKVDDILEEEELDDDLELFAAIDEDVGEE